MPDLADARPDIEEGEEQSIAEDADVETISEWELDFCSRPILDGRGKKLWELVVCDSRRQLQFTRFFPNNVINSVTLRDALLYIMDTLEVPKPEKIRFFRWVIELLSVTQIEIKKRQLIDSILHLANF